ncbi:MAG: hypothetical protein BWX88_03832 [Planctomycetes bacterium ADurb.Bin126]|nr:MAG: hypothetical protein BWX88_03832 [Planctomycetes bacterium ADurb.Bin126]HOD84248.1 hypothetical protein [Phycisphaerae bacterium]HQL75449.1 hypothetical protein [Phycisphaerae bacterium]
MFDWFRPADILNVGGVLFAVGGIPFVVNCGNRGWRFLGAILILAGGMCFGLALAKPRMSEWVTGTRPRVPNVTLIAMSPDGKSVAFPEPTLEGARWAIIHKRSSYEVGEFVQNLRYRFDSELEDVWVYLEFADGTTSEKVRVYKSPPAATGPERE